MTAGAGLRPAGGSLRTPEAHLHPAAPDTADRRNQSKGGGPRGNQGFPREASGHRRDALLLAGEVGLAVAALTLA
jgi:hypothetical protein